LIHLEILPIPQRVFWDEHLATLPLGWVLYRGTANALHLGHRQSRDFDFFSSDPLDRKELRGACPALASARTLQDEPDTLTVVAEIEAEPVKLSFFGGIDFGRVGEPVRIGGTARSFSLGAPTRALCDESRTAASVRGVAALGSAALRRFGRLHADGRGAGRARAFRRRARGGDPHRADGTAGASSAPEETSSTSPEMHCSRSGPLPKRYRSRRPSSAPPPSRSAH
jgi:hypothetical protein